MGACLLSFAAGALTVLSPCVLPLLPFAVASAFARHRWGPVALAGGLVASSASLGLLFAVAGFAIDRDIVRAAAGALLVLLGAVLLSTRLQTGFAMLAAPLAGRAEAALGGIRRPGWQGQFAVGLLLGAIWTPCAGPTLAAAIMLAAQRTDLASAAAVMGAFSLGAVLPLLGLAYGSREAFRLRIAGVVRTARPVTAVCLIVVGLLTLSGGDRLVEAGLTRAMPAWLVDLTTLL